ncbi:hypothetical protein DSM3645_03388 [Blastopirellula marina DSM 3645]|uniref:Uncharacterized protein n=1 Tax=Blastopirellula marina DSM 3645 TaxID=314230 RepID=A3ZVZ1_9BACT|nr:hypothetical protein DSM3645_03388 [Blastopirellula marina DSM 3645]
MTYEDLWGPSSDHANCADHTAPAAVKPSLKRYAMSPAWI